MIVQAEKKRFSQVWHELCKNTKRFLYITWQLLSIDVTLGSTVFLQLSNITAEFYGDAVMIWSGLKVKVDEIFRNHRVCNICYRYLPIKHIDTLLCVIRGTGLIVNSILTLPFVENIEHMKLGGTD